MSKFTRLPVFRDLFINKPWIYGYLSNKELIRKELMYYRSNNLIISGPFHLVSLEYQHYIENVEG